MKKNAKHMHENCDDDDLIPIEIELDEEYWRPFDNDEFEENDNDAPHQDINFQNNWLFDIGLLKNIPTNDKKNNAENSHTWIKPSETITIHGRVISKGLFYTSLTTSMWDIMNTPSLINYKLKVSPSKYTFERTELDFDVEYYADGTLRYYHNYIELSRECKGVYLDWLASSRQDPNTHIGYVRLYFSGLESRIVNNIDNNLISNDEYLQIYYEVERLQKTYSHNRLFATDTQQFLDFLSLTRSDLFYNKKNNHSYKYRLAKTVHEKRPINAELAWEWLLNSRDVWLPRTYFRYEDELKQLFTIYYTDKFKDGLIVKPNKKRLTVSYQLSYNHTSVEFHLGDLPDPSKLKAPIRKINAIILTCIEELKKYGRYLAKETHTKDDIKALVLLPNILIKKNNYPIINDVKKWATNAITKKNGIVPFLSLWKLLKLPTPKAVNKKERTLIQALLDHIGISFAPDIRFHDEKIQANAKLFLFNPMKGKPLKPSVNLTIYSIIINLSLMMALVGGRISTQKKQILTNLINHNNDLLANEKLSLHAYLTWRIHTPLPMRFLKSKIKNLPDHAKDIVKDIIISLALTNERIDPDEIQKLEKLYVALGFEKSLALRDLHNNHSIKSKGTHHAHSPSQGKTSKKDNKFSLDEKSLASHEEETKKSQLMLESIFTDDHDNDHDHNHHTEEKQPITQAQDNHSPGLSDNYLHFYNELSIKKVWKRIDVEKKAKKFNLMIDGAMEIINDWSYDMVDAPVIEDDGDIHIDLDIVQELTQK